MAPSLIRHHGCIYRKVEAAPMVSFQRCKKFKAKSRQEQKKQIEECKRNGGSWVTSYCFCKRKHQSGIR